MIRQIAVFLIVFTVSFGVTSPVPAHNVGVAMITPPFVNSFLVGGQNGTWYGPGQSPRLYEVYLQNDSHAQLTPTHGNGTVWGGGFNGSQSLISGWGTDDDSQGPYLYLFDGAHVVTEGSLDEYGQASSWSGGDIFAASYNGKEWLLSGLGSGPLYGGPISINHMSLGTFNGTVFTDLSSFVPGQQDAILYTNAWNGQYWLIGGGNVQVGILFTFDGNRTADLTAQAKAAIPNFASVQSIGWNGAYWLIGGMGFLAQYDGNSFVDLTQELKYSLRTNDFQSVNAIAWNGQSWILGGGPPIAQLNEGHAWIATYTPSGNISDLSSTLPRYVSAREQTSSILTITPEGGLWILGGYSGARGTLFAYENGYLADYSNLVSDMTYVNWVSNLQVLAS